MHASKISPILFVLVLQTQLLFQLSSSSRASLMFDRIICQFNSFMFLPITYGSVGAGPFGDPLQPIVGVFFYNRLLVSPRFVIWYRVELRLFNRSSISHPAEAFRLTRSLLN